MAPSTLTDAVVDRSTVADPTKPWIGGHDLVWDRALSSGDLGVADLWATWVNKNGKTVAALYATLDYTTWDGTTGAVSNYTHFFNSPGQILGALPAQIDNDTASELSFTAAHTLVTNVENWLDTQSGVVGSWLKNIDADDSDLQGSAAGALKGVLESFQGQIDSLRTQLTMPMPGPNGSTDLINIPQAMTDAGAALHTAATGLWTDFQQWRDGASAGSKWTGQQEGSWTVLEPSTATEATPIVASLSAFKAAVAKLTVHTDANGNFAWISGGPSIDPNWWSEMNAAAMSTWLNYVGVLDIIAGNYMTPLETQFQTTTATMRTLVVPPLSAPSGTTPPGGGGDTGGGTPPPVVPPPGPNKDDVIPPPKTGGGGNGNLGLGGGGNGNLGLGGGGGQAPLLDKNGKPLLDKNGQPEFVPPGTTINSKGELIGPDGKPLLGPDGKPRFVPQGTTVGQPSSTGGGGSIGIGGAGGLGGNFKVPVGSKINADGTVTGPDGKPVLDANGNPVVLAKGSTIDKDGTVLDANGKPVLAQDQLLTDEEHAFSQPNGGLQLGGGGTGGGSYLPPLTLGGFGTSGDLGLGGLGSGSLDSFGSSGSGLGGGSGLLSGGGGGTTALGPPTIGTGGRLPSTVVSGDESGAPGALGEEPGALNGEQAAAEAAAEEAELTGRSVATTGGGSMMPPMGGMGAGAGGQAGQGGQERQRTTWLSEDEEVWGTDSGAVTGVIGR